MTSRSQPDTTIAPPNRRDTAQAAARPTLIVGSAERAIQDLREVAAADIAGLLKGEVDRARGAARQALGSLKQTLAELERSCEAAMSANPEEAKAAAAGFLDRLVTAATAASEAAAQRARAEVRVELEQVQATLADVRAEFAKLRTELESTSGKLQAEQKARAETDAALKGQREAVAAVNKNLEAQESARVRAEAALKDAERARAEVASSYEAKLQAVQAELESKQADLADLQQMIAHEKAERARIVAAIQRVVDPGDAGAAVAVEVSPATPSKTTGRAAAPTAAAAIPSPRKNRSATDAPAPEALEAPPELVVYVEHLFHTVESMYAADASAGRKSDDLVSRLTQNLRSARNVFRNHIGAAENDDLAIFDQQLSKLLETPEETAFTRHLGIAAYECLKPERA